MESILLWRYRNLVFELAKRDFSGRYLGSLGGVMWSFIQPLLLLAVYTVAFGIILKARWGFPGGTSEYALMLFAGLIVFNAFSECLTKAPTLITRRSSLRRHGCSDHRSSRVTNVPLSATLKSGRQ